MLNITTNIVADTPANLGDMPSVRLFGVSFVGIGGVTENDALDEAGRFIPRKDVAALFEGIARCNTIACDPRYDGAERDRNLRCALQAQGLLNAAAESVWARRNRKTPGTFAMLRDAQSYLRAWRAAWRRN